MHQLWPGLLPQHVFAERAARRFRRALHGPAGGPPASPGTPTSWRPSSWSRSCRARAACASTTRRTCAGCASLRRVRRPADRSTRSPPGSAGPGELFAATTPGSRPDMMCVGKALTGGYMSLAATLCTERVARGSLGEVPCSCTGRPSWATRWPRPSRAPPSSFCWERRGARTSGGSRSACGGPGGGRRGRAGVKDVRVLGAIGVIEAHDPIDVTKIQEIVMRHGVWLRPFGRLLYTMPPY